jgi:hypothetical protein
LSDKGQPSGIEEFVAVIAAIDTVEVTKLIN